jgi:hypothetical protein
MMRKIASVTFTAFLRTEEKSTSVFMAKNKIVALPGFLKH